LSEPLAIVLAAGKGTRMKSDLPKVLVPVLGRPMVRYVLDVIRSAGIGRILVVVGYRDDLVRTELGGEAGVEFVQQAEQLGTGHAVMMCRQAIATHAGGVLVLAGDSPLMQATSLMRVMRKFVAASPACLIGTAYKDDPSGLGRVVRDAAGNFERIVEEKDATPQQKQIKEVNMSTYVFASPDLLWALDQLTRKNAQKEYYITDCPGILQSDGKTVLAEPALEPCEALSINTVEELKAVEEEMQRQTSR
jgi:bifunctional UDP-N-acetylglucosamine pyrophosphorylase/glucosamine-1-phosphate N-acetyltransferase/UDP-N-acetylglucosamine pyrophosphorylase